MGHYRRLPQLAGVAGHSALNAVMLADIWKNYPLVTLLVLAALQSIPEDLYEAARLDGASSWRRFRAITFPAIVAPLGVALVLRTIDAFKVFDIIYVMTRGGPLDSTRTLSFFVYQESPLAICGRAAARTPS